MSDCTASPRSYNGSFRCSHFHDATLITYSRATRQLMQLCGVQIPSWGIDKKQKKKWRKGQPALNLLIYAGLVYNINGYLLVCIPKANLTYHDTNGAVKVWIISPLALGATVHGLRSNHWKASTVLELVYMLELSAEHGSIFNINMRGLGPKCHMFGLLVHNHVMRYQTGQ